MESLLKTQIVELCHPSGGQQRTVELCAYASNNEQIHLATYIGSESSGFEFTFSTWMFNKIIYLEYLHIYTFVSVYKYI